MTGVRNLPLFPSVPGSAASSLYLPPFAGGVTRTVAAKLADLVNVKDFNASGSNTSTTGTITAGTSALALSSAIDFANGQGIRVNHAGAAFTLNPPTSPAVANVGTPGGVTYTYSLCSLDANGGVGAAIANFTTTTGAAVLNTTNYNMLSWVNATGTQPSAYVIYGRIGGSLAPLAIVRGTVTSWLDQGSAFLLLPDWLPATPQGVSLPGWLVTTVISGAGTTSVVLAANATTTATNQSVDHDDSVAIQTAIGALPPLGGEVWMPPGNYVITTPIAIGNGSVGGASSVHGIRLRGQSVGHGITGFPGTPGNGSNVNIISAVRGINAVGVSVNGVILGWSLKDITISFDVFAGNTIGLQSNSAWYGDNVNLAVIGAGQFGILETANSNIEGGLNAFTHTQIWMPPLCQGATGIYIGGSTSAHDITNDFFRDTNIIPNHSTHIALRLAMADTTVFDKLLVNPANCTAVMFDYTVNPIFPSGCVFQGFEVFSTNSIVNNGIPTGGLNANYIYGFSEGNGHTNPNLPNLNPSLPTMICPGISLTGQTIAIGNTTLWTPWIPGAYRLSFYLGLTTVGTGGTIQLSIAWSDGSGAVQTIASTAIATTAKNFSQAVACIHSVSGVAVSYAVLFAGVTGAPQYQLYIKVEKMD